MCKLALITGRISRSQTHAALTAINKSFAQSQRDGFGFLASGHQAIGIGRYLDPERFAGFGTTVPDRLLGPQAETGTIPHSAHLLMVHGRTSTNRGGLENVHPFTGPSGAHSLMHNGCVQWIGAGPAPESAGGCDSDMFSRWLDTGANIKEARDAWSGWGAVLLYDHESRTARLVKDNATRFCLARRSDGGWIGATTADDVHTIADVIGVRLACRPLSVPACVIRFGHNGEIESDHPFAGFADRPIDRGAFFRSTGVTHFGREYATNTTPIVPVTTPTVANPLSRKAARRAARLAERAKQEKLWAQAESVTVPRDPTPDTGAKDMFPDWPE